ncbi:PIAS1 [Lepeophtheirus salmonis]|uniref:PIAS1 n=1 Tax=Lepeophtheirus salmonis TaxID=72036 RepID=A0A7R8HAX6_LEPSM|nr:PIAS1 [Lepeophtheirus salmonis]CAF2982300.1 PIAS1 [Lepeophtheirus salmonis]
MADLEMVQAMVMNFRLSELQALMAYAGKSKSGRKSDLQIRALNLIRLNSNDIKMKIRELNNEMPRPGIGIGNNNKESPLNQLLGERSTRSRKGESDNPSSNALEEAPVTRRGARSTRTRVSYAEPDEDETSEVLSDSSSDESEESDKGYNPPSEEEEVVESGGEDTDSAIPLSPSHSPTRLHSKKSANLPNILKKSPRGHISNTGSKTIISSLLPTIKTADILVPHTKTVVPIQNSEPKYDIANNGHLMYPPCPDVQLVSLPFYKVEAILLKPSSLNPSDSARFQVQTFVFHLTPSQANAIAGSGYRDATGKLEYKNQIQMRFCLNETSCPQDDNFPASICVIVNGRSQALPNIIPTNKPGVEPKRPPKPINITSNCKLSATLPNYLNVTWTVEAGKGFCVAIYYVEKLTSNTLIKILKDKGNRHSAYTKAIIKDKLNDRDCEIATTSCKVTLACPLGKMRMSLPCRATTCDHLQCFDARLYIQMNERKPKWICPVCNKNAMYENLMVDGYFFEVLNDPKLGTENEIVLKNDAEWEALPSKDEESSSSSQKPKSIQNPIIAPPVNNTSVETVDVYDDEDDEAVKAAKAASLKSATTTNKASEDKIVECITLDDSDEESPANPPAKKTRYDNEYAESCIPISSDTGSLSSSSSFSSNDSNRAAAISLKSKMKIEHGLEGMTIGRSEGQATRLNHQHSMTFKFLFQELMDLKT